MLPVVGVGVGAAQIVRGVANTPSAIKQACLTFSAPACSAVSRGLCCEFSLSMCKCSLRHILACRTCHMLCLQASV